jgi:hypothetical protein
MHNLSPGFLIKARWALFLVVLAGLGNGCGGAGRVAAPTYDPDSMARAAMLEFDRNSDGKLDAAELEACPALKSALPRITEGKRAYLTEEDIANELREFQESKLGLRSVRCRVLRDGLGVAGVVVTCTPESFMNDVIKPGTGTSDAKGNVHLKIVGEDTEGLALGYYRVEASLKESGKETLPEQFNKTTKLGLEVSHKKMDSFQIVLEP